MTQEFELSPRFVEKIMVRYPDAEVLAGIPIGWTGWELDEEAAVIVTGGRRILVTTDHGRLIRRPPRWLDELQATYRQWIALTEAAARQLSDQELNDR